MPVAVVPATLLERPFWLMPMSCAGHQATVLPVIFAPLVDENRMPPAKLPRLSPQPFSQTLLYSMVVGPFVYTYSVHPSDDETPAVTEVWRLWWDRRQKSFPPVDAEARQYLEKKLAEMAATHDKIDADTDEIFKHG